MRSLNPDIKIAILLFEIIFVHVIADFNLLRKQWWVDVIGKDLYNLYNDKYRYFYKIALLIHSFVWSFTIHILFSFLYTPNYKIYLSIIINTVFHYIIDDLKAEKLKIDLVQNQLLHLLQINITIGILILSKAFTV